MSKITVKGSEMHPLYQFLTQVKKNGLKSSTVSWNFQKYLIGQDGKLKKIITPRTAPMSEEVIDWVREDESAVTQRL
jgi:glutathione peroxidase